MISTHILDTTAGVPAANVEVVLEKKENNNWIELKKAKTNNDGRIVFENEAVAGSYRLTFKIEEYFKDSFFLNTQVAFKITNTQRKYHIPLLLNPYGYSTYRGS